MELDGDNFEVWRGFGLALLQQGDPVAAAQKFETAVDLAPDELLSWTAWGDALAASGRFHDAFRKYHVAIDLNPVDTRPRVAWREALTRYIDAGEGRCRRAGLPVSEYLRVAGSGVPTSFRAELVALRTSCGLSVPRSAEDS